MTRTEVEALARGHLQSTCGMSVPVWLLTECSKKSLYEAIATHFYGIGEGDEVSRLLRILNPSRDNSKWWIVIFETINQGQYAECPICLCLVVDDASAHIHQFAYKLHSPKQTGK